MFESYYSTKMSGSARLLAARFEKMHSRSGRRYRLAAAAVTAALAMAVGMAAAAFAAIDSPNEKSTQERVYFLAGLSGYADFAPGQLPGWADAITADGRLTVLIQRVDIKQPDGVVMHKRQLYLTGSEGSCTLHQTASSGYIGDNGEYALLVFDTDRSANAANPSINPGAAYLCLAEPGSEICSQAGLEADHFIPRIASGEYSGFTLIKNAAEIGNFVRVENSFKNGICANYYTLFEMSFKNRTNPDFTIKTVACDENAVTAELDISDPSAFGLEVIIADRTALPSTGFSKTYPLSDLHGVQSFPAPGVLKKGVEYTVNYIVKDSGGSVVYRQQDKFEL